MMAYDRLFSAEARLSAFQTKSSFGRKITLLPVAFWSLLVVWQSRASQRANLAQLEPYHLEDMGISLEEARREAAKPFWRP